MSMEKTNELKRPACAPLPYLPLPQTSWQDRYAAITTTMAELTLAEIRLAFEPVADKSLSQNLLECRYQH